MSREPTTAPGADGPDAVNWLDLATLTAEQQDGLLALVHSQALQKAALAAGDPRVFIIFDHAKQAELFRLALGRPRDTAPLDLRVLLATALGAASGTDNARLAQTVLDTLDAAGQVIVPKPREGWSISYAPTSELWPPYNAAS